MENGISKEQIRSIVRDALQQATSKPKSASEQTGKAPDTELGRKVRSASRSKDKSAVSVQIRTGHQLNEFARELIAVAQNSELKDLIVSGKVEFKLVDASASKKSASDEPIESVDAKREGDCSFESGILTESKILKLAKNYQRVVLGKKAVLTPLARDRARSVKLEILRQQT